MRRDKARDSEQPLHGQGPEICHHAPRLLRFGRLSLEWQPGLILKEHFRSICGHDHMGVCIEEGPFVGCPYNENLHQHRSTLRDPPFLGSSQDIRVVRDDVLNNSLGF